MLRLPLRFTKSWHVSHGVWAWPCQQRQRLSRPGPGRRRYATATNAEDHLKPGEKLHGFTLKRTKHVPELSLTALHLQHDKTGTDYLHVARDDKNNVFSIGFKTNPPDNTGVPHILEHTTLCGSKRYPVRDPFFKMLPRSLSNFMNAFTSSDHTSYPFATTNRTDFSNLMSVYLDATLNPLLNENDFIQEGWRIGPQNPKAVEKMEVASQEEQNLVFKGVVYNEMKGQVSDASYLYYIKFQESIFPEINNSGGDPQQMTNLTYQSLKDFHATNYHPSNAKIFTYGDMPLADHLQEVDRQLAVFEKSKSDTAIKFPRDLSQGPFIHMVKGPADPLVDRSSQYKTSTSWLLGDTADILETFSLSIMSSLLLDGYGCPMYQALIEAGLGSDFTPNTGFDGGARRGIFSVGLNGVKEIDLPKVKEVIHSTLQEVHLKGFDEGKVEGLLHQLEIALKHKTANFGMGLMQRLEPAWFNGVDPFDTLAWNDTVNAFRTRFYKGGYLEGLLNKYLLNDRTLTFTMEPSSTYTADVKAQESSRLQMKISEVVSQTGGETETHEKLVARELQLLEEQSKSSDQDLSCLPRVYVQDIPRQMERKMIRSSSVGKVKVQWREASTNGLTYFRAINNFEGLPTGLRMLLPLFADAVMRLGTKDKSIEEIEDLIKLKTGGLSVSYHSSPSPTNMGTSTEGLLFSGYALDNNVPTMFRILHDILWETNFDGPLAESQIRQLLQQDASGALDAVASSGHSYACRYAQAGLTTQGLLNEQASGLTQIQTTATLANRKPTESLEDVIEKLKAIRSFELHKASDLRTAITCGHGAASGNRAELKKFLTRFPTSPHAPVRVPVSGFEDYKQKTFVPLPYQVYYSGLSIPTVSYVDSSGAALQILSQLLTHKHLHHEIREKGGAYGAGASARGLSGIFSFYSYRDPNPENTLKIMQEAGRWARDRDWTDQDLEEAKLSTFQSVDAPTSVNEDGMVRFLSGITEEMEQKKREQMLDVNKADVQEVAQRFLVDGMKDARVAVLGEKKDWAKEDEGWSIKNIELS